MKITKSLVLFRHDLKPIHGDKNIKDIQFHHFYLSKETIEKQEIILFVDRDLSTHILKCKYGKI